MSIRRTPCYITGVSPQNAAQMPLTSTLIHHLRLLFLMLETNAPTNSSDAHCKANFPRHISSLLFEQNSMSALQPAQLMDALAGDVHLLPS